VNALLSDALNRTLLLMRDEVVGTVDDATLISALTSTSIVLVGDARNLSNHAAQSAFITAAVLMARSGHRVHLAAPDVPLMGEQPPLKGDRLITALLAITNEFLPEIGLSVYPPRGEAALAVLFGDSPSRVRARRTINVNASEWSAILESSDRAQRWIEPEWPCGALAAGALASVEAFKAAMHRVRPWANDKARFDELFRFTDRLRLELAPASTVRISTLGHFDFVSGGAITNSTFYVLARLPGVAGFGRVIEPQIGECSNLNRYPLMLQSGIGELKAAVLQSLMPPQLALQAVPVLYEGGRMLEIGEFAPNVLVGVDDIPARWKVQAQEPQWLGIGATTHWDAMASYHERGLACARCLHPRDDPATGPIPTVAFVSFFAGLMLTCYFLRMLSGERVPKDEQHTYFSPLRAERLWRTPVAMRMDCPICSPGAGVRAA
jgi:hypothetical protein